MLSGSEPAARPTGGGRASVAAPADVETIARRHGAELKRQHPDASDPELSRIWTCEVPDRRSGQRLAEDLLRSGAVEAAYIKPDDAMP